MKMENKWLTPQLKEEVRKVFEPRYKRKLSDADIVSIAVNLTSLLEVFFKFKWRTNETNNS
jgi:hypothetical protein